MGTQLVRGIHLPADDTHFAGHLEKGPLFKGHGTYQFSKIEAVLPLVTKKRVAIDVGAHVGLWSLVLAESFDQVIAFEPVPAHAECFRMNMEDASGYHKYKLKHVELHTYALGAKRGEINIQTVPGNSGNAKVAKQGQSVVVSTLDYALDHLPAIDFIKIDVEGFEQAVVLGGELIIKRHKPVLVVEQKPGHAESQGFKTGGVIDILKEWGYEQAWVRAGDHCLIWKR